MKPPIVAISAFGLIPTYQRLGLQRAPAAYV
jgi:hypothetical protein